MSLRLNEIDDGVREFGKQQTLKSRDINLRNESEFNASGWEADTTAQRNLQRNKVETSPLLLPGPTCRSLMRGEH
jgi:hypothetical protein